MFSMHVKIYHFNRSFFVALFIFAFGLNWLWEMLQMPAYVKTPASSWQAKVFVCTVASLIDAVITLGVCGLGGIFAGRLQWAMRGGWKVSLIFALGGAMCAVIIERFALAFGFWSYSDRMGGCAGAGHWLAAAPATNAYSASRAMDCFAMEQQTKYLECAAAALV